ncbi:MAG: peptidase T, partial [Sphaerochaetaceae bacterium]|nr:peptidase T [Sphaerochaetaceae bacterium]
MNLNKSVLDNFLRYVVVDSQSDPHFSGEKVPTTDCQWDLLKMLEKELKDLGLKKVILHDKGYV